MSSGNLSTYSHQNPSIDQRESKLILYVYIVRGKGDKWKFYLEKEIPNE